MPKGFSKIMSMMRGHPRVVALADQGSVSAANLITTIVIGRVCGQGELGLYTLGMSLVLAANAAQVALILTPYKLLNPRIQGTSHKQYKGSVLIHQVVFLALIVAILATAGLSLSKSVGHNEVGNLVLVLSLPAALMVFREFARQISYGELQLPQAFFLDVTMALIQVTGILTLAFTGQLNAFFAFLVIGVACAIPGFAWLVLNRESVEINFDHLRMDFSKNWSLGRWLFASGVVRQASLGLFPWLIFLFHGASTVGIWAAAAGVIALSNPVMLAFYNEAGPRMSHDFAAGGISALRASALKTTRACSLMALPFALILLFWGGDLIVLFYGGHFSGNHHVIVFLALAQFIDACSFAVPISLLVLGRPALDFAGNIAALTIFLSLGLWAVAEFGAGGAAFSLFAGTLCQIAAMVLGLRWALKRAPTGSSTLGDRND